VILDRERGFSLLEAVIATALMLAATAAAFSMMHPAQGAFATESDRSDMQQRLRVAADTLSSDLMMAGAGAYQGPHTGSLLYYLPPVLPFRKGAADEDPPGTFTTDRITVIYVPATRAQSTLAAPLTGAAPDFSPADRGACPLDPATASPAPLCGFAEDQTVLVFDGTGSYGLFTITAASGTTATLAARAPAHGNSTFPAGSKIVEAEAHTDYLRAGTFQLMRHDGRGRDVPVVDNLVGLHFDYYGEQQPPSTCFFSAASPLSPLPAVLGDGSQALVPVTSGQLTDGPFCPSDADQNRWDADLLRIRRIAVTLRVQTPLAALRGPAGALFAQGGSSHGGARWLPDQEIHFDVSPRNLNLAR
jgi:type II secretory pathway pseudopilin PulG